VQSENASSDEESEVGLKGRAGGRGFRRELVTGSEGKARGCGDRRKPGTGSEGNNRKVDAWRKPVAARRYSRKMQRPRNGWKLVRSKSPRTKDCDESRDLIHGGSVGRSCGRSWKLAAGTAQRSMTGASQTAVGRHSRGTRVPTEAEAGRRRSRLIRSGASWKWIERGS
jgi:hypothetical protein